ncbi:hypothetical protein ACFLY9_01195 [Patescibacteria group bacterium]
MKCFIINDLQKATVKAKANFLVAMGIFNYIEILGSFYYYEKNTPCQARFDYTLRHLFPNAYINLYTQIKRMCSEKVQVYDILRCGLTHEYLVKTYKKGKKTLEINYQIIGVDDVVAYGSLVQSRKCGIEIITLDNKRYYMKIYNPRLIYDLNLAFEEFKKRLIGNLGDCRERFKERCKIIHLENFI